MQLRDIAINREFPFSAEILAVCLPNCPRSPRSFLRCLIRFPVAEIDPFKLRPRGRNPILIGAIQKSTRTATEKK